MINEGYIKQSPFAGFGGFGGGATTILLGGGGAEKYWIAVAGDSGVDHAESNGVAVDSKGNVYVNGGDNRSSVNNGRAYIIKYSPDGELEWQRAVGTTTVYKEDLGYRAAVDSSDNAYFVVQTESSGTTGSYDLCLLKYNGDGVLQWQRFLGGTNVDLYPCLTIDSSDRVFVGLTYRTTKQDPLVALYDTSGTIQWKRHLNGGTFTKYTRDVSADSSGNVYITWDESMEYHIAKWNSSGTFQWQRARFGNGFNANWGSCTHSNGDSYIVGREGYGNFGGIMKYDAAGDYQWAKEVYQPGATGTAQIIFQSADTDEDGNVYIAGRVGSTTPYIAILKIDSDGDKIWGRKISGSGNDVAYNIKVKGEVMYITGQTTTSGAGPINYITIKLPTDGSLLGTYGDYTYAVWLDGGGTDYRDWAPAPSNYQQNYTEDDATGATDKAGTLPDAAGFFTVATTPVEE